MANVSIRPLWCHGITMMKAILVTRTGAPSVLDYVDVPMPQPLDDQVLVKADTIGVSRPEVMVRNGTYPWMPKLPTIPGIEMTGTVVDSGRDVTELVVGQKVFVSARELCERSGCYAEYIAVPARAPFRLPDDADLEAAACLSNYQVAYHIIHTAGRVAPGGIVVIDSAAGGMGSALVQLAKIAGMRVIAVAGGKEKIDALREYGADHVVDHARENTVARVAEITTGKGADLVLDGIGGKSFAQKFPMVGAFGLIVVYGWLQGRPEENLVENLNVTYFKASPAVRFFTMHTMDDKPWLRAESMNYLIGKLHEGMIRPLIHARLHLSEARMAHELLEERRVIGKLLLKP
jgi:NADPH:quinone reductase